MWFLIVGVVLLGMKLAEVGPGAEWSWWIVLAPFALAAAWWSFSDAMGLTQAREMRKMDARQAARRQKAVDDLGLGSRRKKR